MSTTETERPAAPAAPPPGRLPDRRHPRSPGPKVHPSPGPAPRPAPRPARPGPTPFADWRGQAVTEELAAVPPSLPPPSLRHPLAPPDPDAPPAGRGPAATCAPHWSARCSQSLQPQAVPPSPLPASVVPSPPRSSRPAPPAGSPHTPPPRRLAPLSPQAKGISQPPTSVTTYQAPDTHQPPDSPHPSGSTTGPDRTQVVRPPGRQGHTVRTSPSDILFIILTACLTLMAALTLGGLAAHPF